ncbi:exopolysaccharide transport family protein [Limnofasciculus baicalensis]|uniref:non-specific protein-tyrosine kinase n=1 Tax=Limnofasciculus baicalensis BBK-W-15 TaxID=2699891 RepID=A0AAE3KN40_9CYAN|nr:polysaccharide biosynthesis tyrosine autokinase [Limnofasciculus baicalensis]MCP2729914.1 AAA family ATPase [Limnofasciculus baicalensis BBK-W-15]
MSPPIVKRFLISLDRHKIVGIGVFTLITAISGVVALIEPTRTPVSYQVLAELRISTPPRVFSETGQQIQQQGILITEEMLKSENVIKATAYTVGVNPQQIIKNLKVGLQGGEAPAKGKGGGPPSGVIIGYQDTEEGRAGKTVAVLMQKMIEHSRLINSKRLTTIIDSIQKRSTTAKAELKQAEEQLERLDRIGGAAFAISQDQSLPAEITGAQQQQRQLQQTLEGLDTQMASLEKRLGLTADEAYTSSALSADPIIQSLRSQIQQNDTQVEMLRSQGYLDAHPNVETLLQQQQTYSKMLAQRGAEVIGGNGLGEAFSPTKVRQDSNLDPTRMQMANQLVALQTQRETLKQQLEFTKRTEQKLQQQYKQIPTQRLERSRLEQQLKIKQEFYSKLQAQLIDAQAAEAEAVSNLFLVDDKLPQEQKVGGELKGVNSGIALGGGVVVALLVASGSILLLAILDSTLYSPQEIIQVLVQHDVQVLAELPVVISLDPDFGQTGIILKPDSPYLDLYERFRSKLRRGENKSIKVVAISSTIEGEGKTVSAYNLAIASAQAGKRTLLIEANLRSPSQARFLRVPTEPDARVEPLRYYSSINRCVKFASEIENLYIVPSPGPLRQAVAVIESSELQRLIADARSRFDFVVVDTPPLSRWDDARLLQPLTDGMILVTRPGTTQKSILDQAARELSEVEPSFLLGAIINGVEQSIPMEDFEDIDDDEYEEEDSFDDDELEEEEEEEKQIPTPAMRF